MAAGPRGLRGGVGSHALLWAVLLASWLAATAAAQGIAFTVQVIAVSDQSTAIDISRGLLRDGFPAYVVRSTGGQGDVYRVRVGAFANRAASARYAAAMPDIGGARPVPALAEAIPGGIMPLAPRVVWQAPVAGADLRVLPWPDGVALRRQASDPLRQATYELIQGAEVRTVHAWRLAPLAELPATAALVEVPFVDLTVAAAEPPNGGPPSDADAPPEGGAAGDLGDGGADAVAGAAPGGAGVADGEAVADGEEAGVQAAEPADAAAPGADPDPADAASDPDPADDDSGAGATAATEMGADGGEGSATREAATAADAPAWADPTGGTPEAGLLLLRNRSLWPPTWPDDGEEVREAFRQATLGLVANRVDLDARTVEAHTYLPGGGPPPALVVVEVSDRSGRDLGDVRGLADPRQGLRPEGPPPTAGLDATWWPIGGIGDRVPLDGGASEPVGGSAWTLTGDGGFVRITTGDGASWRAVAGAPLWSDGRYALVRDGADVVLIDFLPR